MEQEESKSPSDAASESSDHESNESETELMVTSRSRRTTAGNRYGNVVAQEQATAEDEEDDVALLFAEMEGEDEEYHSDEGADDADMSSSDDDDQGPNAAADDLEGEKEIQREAKAERARKRKADLALTSISGLRKKPKIDPTALRRAPAPKPSKRKERVSWLPDQGFAPGRTSLRKQTLEHRAETHAKLKKNEQQRLKAKSIRAQRVKEREAEAPKELTQADRLVEAERVERRNAKSLNRWEATEKKRQEEQAAKLAALKERKLEGAVVSMRSARHTFRGWRNMDNPDGETGEVKKRGRKSKAYLEQLAAAKLLQDSSPSLGMPIPQPEPHVHPPALDPAKTNGDPPVITPAANDLQQTESISQPANNDAGHGSSQQALLKTDDEAETQHQKSTNALDRPESIGILPHQDETISKNPDESTTVVETHSIHGEQEPESTATQQEKPQFLPTTSTVGTEDDTLPDRSTHAVVQEPVILQSQSETTDAKHATSTVESVLKQDGTEKAALEAGPQILLQPIPAASQMDPSNDLPAPVVENVPVPEVVSIRNLVTVENLDSLPSQARSEYGFFYSTRKTTSKPTKHTPDLCLITGLPVRYRDPVTGLGYHNTAAFQKIRALREHKFMWSGMLGCYVGSASLVARGVPEGFSG